MTAGIISDISMYTSFSIVSIGNIPKNNKPEYMRKFLQQW